MNVTYRRATFNDARIIAETHCASWRTTYPGLLPEHVIVARTDAEKRTEVWDAILREGKSDVWLAHAEATSCLGFCSFGPCKSTDVKADGQITALYLLKSAQRSGIGRKLLAIAMEEMIARNYKSACVEVLKDNPAEKFYLAMGSELARTVQVQEFGVETTENIYVWASLADALKTQVQLRPRA
jgi:ribosomal protein S18 acetylase RimI-like enzyme